MLGSGLETTAVGMRSHKDNLSRGSGGEEEHLAGRDFRRLPFV